MEPDGASIALLPRPLVEAVGRNETAMACLMSVVGQGGLERVRTTVLLTPEEGKEAMENAYAVLQSQTGKQS